MPVRSRLRTRVLLVVGLALALGPASAALVASAGPAAAAGRCTGEVPDGQVQVAIVVDAGTEPGAPGGPSVECALMPAGSTGADLLRDRAGLLGTPKPRYAASGLLCAIDGYPSSGCGETSEGLYRYWSYWSGTGGRWEYGSGNPFTRRLRDGDIEGWRFQAGHANPSDAPPRVAPDAGALFPSAPPAPSPPPPSGGGPSGGGSGPSSGGSGSSGSTGSPGSGAAGGGGADPGSAESVPGDEATGPADETTLTPGGTATSGRVGADGAGGATTEELAAQPAGSSSSGVPLGLMVGGVAVVGLGAAAAVRFRRRPEA